ncbi:uncharacterized protein LOC144575777 isoform X1 [Carex rostrata]
MAIPIAKKKVDFLDSRRKEIALALFLCSLLLQLSPLRLQHLSSPLLSVSPTSLCSPLRLRLRLLRLHRDCSLDMDTWLIHLSVCSFQSMDEPTNLYTIPVTVSVTASLKNKSGGPGFGTLTQLATWILTG